jgi:hypothetical protein
LVTKRGGAANLATLVPFFTSFAFSDVIHQYSTSVSSANVSCGSQAALPMSLRLCLLLGAIQT